MTRRIFIGDVQGCRVELERLLHKITAKRPADRPPTADAVIVSLREIARQAADGVAITSVNFS